MTPPERRLWSVLKGEPDGFRFRRQHPCGPYTLDFFCPTRGLVIEVDGEVHGRGEQPEHDARRDAWLGAQGFTILRIPAFELIRDLDAVLRHILHTAALLRPLHHPAAPGGPPPPLREGGD
jgi:very-short-patch-repair endonuclease